MSTSPNNSERQCQSCGEPLPKDAPHGLCPKCLGQAALDSEAGSSASAAYSPTVQLRPTAPKIADIAAHFPQLEILELLGQGGMGVVYKARQPKLDRLVALKILPKDNADPAFAERFQREARALAKLSHPNIVAIHDVGETGGFCYFLMEFVDGMNLRQLQRAKQLTPEEALAIVPKICEALQFAHDEGIVHRDIKPENILMDKRGRVKIADFGLAKLLGKDHTDKSLTGTEQIMGTPHYMAPEQMEATHSVDHRADIYSLGVVFYEMLTGSLPRGRFEAPSKRVQVDVRLDEVVLKTLEYSPDRRYQHASEVKTDVEALTSFAQSRTDTPASGSTTPNRTDLDAARNKVRAAASALFILGILNCVLLVAGLVLLIATNVFQVPLNFAVGEFFPLTLWSLFTPVIAFGAWKMKRLESIEFARFAAVLAMVPMTSPLFLVGIGIGVWCLKTLGLPAVKEAFRGHSLATPRTHVSAPTSGTQDYTGKLQLAAIGLLLAGIANAVAGLIWIGVNVNALIDAAQHGAPFAWPGLKLLTSLGSISVVYYTIGSALFLMHCEDDGDITFPLLMAAIVPPGCVFGLPAAIYAFLLLGKPEVKALFPKAAPQAGEPNSDAGKDRRPATVRSAEQGTPHLSGPPAHTQALAGKAKWGAICASIGFLACLTVFVLVSNMSYHLGLVADGEKAIPDRFWPVILVLTPFCIIMPVAATMMGWQAIREIRTSGGQLSGLGLALFAGLLFPLLLLDAAVVAFFSSLTDFVGGMFRWDYRTKEGLWGSLSLLTCAVIDFSLIIRAWNSVSRKADESDQPAKRGDN